LRHLGQSPKYLSLLPLLGKPLGSVLKSMNLEGFEPLRHYLDCLCQITVQCASAQAEAPFALATMDYYFRGTGHVRGGIGELANALVLAIEKLGSEVRFSSRVKSLRREGSEWIVQTRKGDVKAKSVIANLLPQDLHRLLDAKHDELPRLEELAQEVESGWGAAMLYLVAKVPQGAPEKPVHLELVGDGSAPFVEGNHVFVSISGPHDVGRCPPEHRTMTCSTHVPLASLRGRTPDEQGEYVARIQERMREVLKLRAPEWFENITFSMTASPRTFERFTGRSGGAVGGIPRRANLGHYLSAWPRAVVPGVWMVGDSVFPGQSTLATAIGGTRVAEMIMREHPRRGS
jgi:phytoene dehydrogenase-like protein